MGARILSAFILSITGFLLCIMPGYSHGTGFQFLQYRVENGLKTDIIKTVDEDSLGFIWIGSDQGLMQYNGHSFINYPQASKSPFIKDLIKLRDGRLLVLDDLGLNEIVNLLDTAIFKEILPGTRVPTDTSLWYPKSIFEDSQGNLWIGEPQSVVRYDGNKIDRIEFGPRFNSSSFVRSFCFEEWSPGKILISSYNGDFFYYDNTNGSIEFLSKKLAFGEINHMIKWNGHLYIASNTGLYKIQNIREGQLEVHQLLDIDNISYLLPINDSELLINTFSTSAYIYRPDAKYEQIPYSLTVSNQSFRSKEGNIWLSTEKGLIMLKPQIFEKIPSDNENIYIESVALDTTQDKVYFSSKEHLRTYTHGDEASRIVDVKRNGYFLSIQWHQRQLWSSNASEIYLYNLQNQIISSWDFRNMEGISSTW
ncbi:MAG: hypothetical protein HC819_08765 [Cyclobacteriaceae bacterium]|nr:hypothetical protein [Cyclobacteriaceae bacterium]